MNEDVVVSTKVFTPKIPNQVTDYSLIYTFIKTITTYSSIITCRMSLCGLMKKCIISPRKSNYYDCYDQENSNMLFGMSGFRTEKVILTCLGIYVKQTGIDKVLRLDHMQWKTWWKENIISKWRFTHSCPVLHFTPIHMCVGGGDPAVFSDTSTFISKQQLLFFSQHSFYKRQNISTQGHRETIY